MLHGLPLGFSSNDAADNERGHRCLYSPSCIFQFAGVYCPLFNILFICAAINRAQAYPTMKSTTFAALIALLALASMVCAAEPAPADTGAMYAVAKVDTPVYRNPFEVVVTASRMDLIVDGTTVVGERELEIQPRTIAVDEVVKFVPGVRVDNQADGSRVHMSIRGQGILTERGLRGITVLLDGIPLNDPTGFAPDLYDVDWATLERVDVLRGPASALYGGGSTAGVLNITTQTGADKPFAADAQFTAGSHDFWKSFGQVRGSKGDVRYRVSASRLMGDGYRDHTAFWGNNLAAKFDWSPTNSVEISPVFLWTDYFNDNAEGLNKDQVRENPRQANPDAVPFNEYQLTQRVTQGVTGRIYLGHHQDVQFNAYARVTRFAESVPSSVQHRTFATPGGTVQYNLRSHGAWMMWNDLNVGVDYGRQRVDEYRLKNMGGANEDSLLSNQRIIQNGVGAFLMDRLRLNVRWSVLASLRYDNIKNRLKDLKADTIDLSGHADFDQVTGRIGVAYIAGARYTLYANWGQGFLPPATEELANNPHQQGGFNPDLESATSMGEEIGLCSYPLPTLRGDLAVFHLTTKNDFDRYRMSDRPLETFYRNSGESRRLGAETHLTWQPMHALSFEAAYTWSDFIYTKPDSLKDNVLPNCPEHILAADAEYRFPYGFSLGMTVERQSRWQVDSRNTASVQGFTLLSARAAYEWRLCGKSGELSVTGRNLSGEKYIAFSEPDPDGNSYQPGPTEEVFATLKIHI
jgi:iron complex outermembrane receptor protein